MYVGTAKTKQSNLITIRMDSMLSSSVQDVMVADIK